MLISVAEYESMQETLDILSDEETLADLRQSPSGTGGTRTGADSRQSVTYVSGGRRRVTNL